MPSAIFDKVDVREIGLRSLIKSQIVGALGKGGTSASFHTRGTLHSRKEMFKTSAIGGRGYLNILPEPNWEDCLVPQHVRCSPPSVSRDSCFCDR